MRVAGIVLTSTFEGRRYGLEGVVGQFARVCSALAGLTSNLQHKTSSTS